MERLVGRGFLKPDRHPVRPSRSNMRRLPRSLVVSELTAGQTEEADHIQMMICPHPEHALGMAGVMALAEKPAARVVRLSTTISPMSVTNSVLPRV